MRPAAHCSSGTTIIPAAIHCGLAILGACRIKHIQRDNAAENVKISLLKVVHGIRWTGESHAADINNAARIKKKTRIKANNENDVHYTVFTVFLNG